MSRAPVVSIIMIFLDEQRFIVEAIESVLQQDFTRWELLLVDDGSTDGSTAIAREYAARHADRIRYIEHPAHANRGTGPSRNLGAAHAQGDYLAFLDADDVWEQGKLRWEVELLNNHPEIGWLYGQALLWYGCRPQRARAAADSIKQTGVAAGTTLGPTQLLSMLLKNEYLCPACGSVLLRRSQVREVGGWDDYFRGQYEDMALYAKLSLRTSVYVHGRVHSRYRQHEGNNWVADRAASPWRPEWLASSRRRYLEWVEQYLSQQPDVPAELRAALTDALLPYRQPLSFLLTARGMTAVRQSVLPALKRLLRTVNLR